MTEKDALPCPGCHTPLPPEATGCQICMRPRTRQEIMRGYAKLRDDKARRRRRPFQILAAVLVLAGGGWLLAEHGGALKALASSAGEALGRWTDDMRNPSNYAMKPPEQTPAAPATPQPPPAPGSPVAPESALRSQLFPDDYAPPPAPPAAAPGTAAPAAPKPLAKNAWRVTGTIYDLATLEPVAGARVVFLLDEKQPVETATDENGAYEADIVKGDGWTVNVHAPDRRRGQILDLDPSYRVRDVDERRAVFDNISEGDLIPAPADWKRARSRVTLDLFVIPNRWPPPPRY